MGDTTENKERGAAITEQQVFATCDSYFEQHQKEPSQQKIKETIGGSASTIGPLLRKWKEQRANEAQATLSMPDHIRDSGLTIIATWWQSIQPTINDTIATAQILADKKVSDAKQEVNDAIANQVWLEQENARLEKLVQTTGDEYQQQFEDLQVQLKQSQLEVSDANERAHTEKEKKIAELATLSGERDALKLQISQHNEDIKSIRDTCKEQLVQATKDQERLSTALSQLKNKNSDLAKDNKTSASLLSEIRVASAKIEGELAANKQQNATLNANIKTQRNEYEKELKIALKDKAKAEAKLDAQRELWQTTSNSAADKEKSGGE
jgi:chromosome segregation ATPase